MQNVNLMCMRSIRKGVGTVSPSSCYTSFIVFDGLLLLVGCPWPLCTVWRHSSFTWAPLPNTVEKVFAEIRMWSKCSTVIKIFGEINYISPGLMESGEFFFYGKSDTLSNSKPFSWKSQPYAFEWTCCLGSTIWRFEPSNLCQLTVGSPARPNVT